MSIIYLVLPLALLVVLLGVLAFLWATRRGQYDDLDTPAIRVLHDDAPGASAPDHYAGQTETRG
ncbi:MAG TPA: cbb3-type cytochrome oxidase assembly protein CcoS [Gemmatimonadaceae bacterium]|nr:cbb3-type cytochrome oxidase assembly protein CcoS [Gemmatimonadaceae bacterium]